MAMAVVQKRPSVATVIAHDQGSTSAASNSSPQPQPSFFSQARSRSQTLSVSMAPTMVRGATGPLTITAMARPVQNSSFSRAPPFTSAYLGPSRAER